MSELVSEFSRHLHSPHTIVSASHPDLPNEDRQERTRSIRITEPPRRLPRLDALVPRRWRIPHGMRYLRAALDRIPDDTTTLVVENRPWFGPTLRRRFPTARIVLHQHNVVPDPRRSLEDFDRIVTVSEFLRRQVSAATGHPDCVVSHNGITPPELAVGTAQREDARVRLAVATRPTMTFVGRLVPEKGLDRVLDALPRIRDALPDVCLLVAGSVAFGRTGTTRYERHLRARAAELGEAVQMLGFVPPADLPRIWAASDLLCAPSQWEEPFGLVFLEAQAHGVPVVATRTGGIPEIVEDGVTGTLVDPNADPRELAARCVELLTASSHRDAMVAAARAQVEAHFDWRVRAPGLEDAFLGATSMQPATAGRAS